MHVGHNSLSRQANKRFFCMGADADWLGKKIDWSGVCGRKSNHSPLYFWTDRWHRTAIQDRIPHYVFVDWFYGGWHDYALRYVGRVVRVSRDCTRSPNNRRKNKRCETQPSERNKFATSNVQTFKTRNHNWHERNEAESACNSSEMWWTNAGATFSRKVVLFHATPALSLVPPNVWHWEGPAAMIQIFQRCADFRIVSTKCCERKINCIALKSQMPKL